MRDFIFSFSQYMIGACIGGYFAYGVGISEGRVYIYAPQLQWSYDTCRARGGINAVLGTDKYVQVTCEDGTITQLLGEK